MTEEQRYKALADLLTAVDTSGVIDDVSVEYEVWQKDAFGDGDAMVAGSTSLADAQHYAAMYGQDGPAWVVEVTRRRVMPMIPADYQDFIDRQSRMDAALSTPSQEHRE